MSQQGVGLYEFRPWGDASERGVNHSAVYLVSLNKRKHESSTNYVKSSSSRQVTEEGRDGCGSTVGDCGDQRQ